MEQFSKILAAGVLSCAFAPLALASGNVNNGKALLAPDGKFAVCASCHGKDFNSPITDAYPKLAGQHPDYLAHALRAYKRSANLADGRKHPVMNGMVAPMTEDEMDDIAAYLGSLPATIETHK